MVTICSHLIIGTLYLIGLIVFGSHWSPLVPVSTSVGLRLGEILMLFSDTVQMMSGYADILVIRHPQPHAVSVSKAVLLDLVNVIEIKTKF